MQFVKNIKGLVLVGSAARGKKKVGDYDFITIRNLDDVLGDFIDKGGEVIKKGKKYISVLAENIQYDVWKAESKEELKYMKIMRTIDKGHNIAYRKRARELGMILNDKGLFKGKERVSFVGERGLRKLLGFEGKNANGGGEPIDKELYENVKKDIYRKYPKHSLFRSAAVQKEYMNRGGKYRGKDERGLKNWFSEKWVSLNDFLRGEVIECGASDTRGKYGEMPLCRPLAIAEKLGDSNIKKMIKEKNKLKEKPLRTSRILGTDAFNVGKIGSNL